MSSLSLDVHRDEDTYRQTNFVVVLHELTDSIVSSFYKCNSLPTEFMSLHLLLLKSSVALSQRQSDQIWQNFESLWQFFRGYSGVFCQILTYDGKCLVVLGKFSFLKITFDILLRMIPH